MKAEEMQLHAEMHSSRMWTLQKKYDANYGGTCTCPEKMLEDLSLEWHALLYKFS